VYEIEAGSQDDLPTKVKVVSAKVQRLEKFTEVTPMLTRDLNASQEKSSKLRSDLAELQTAYDALKTQLVDLNGEVTALTTRHGNTESNLQRLQTEHTALSTRHASTEAHLRGVQSSADSRVGNLTRSLSLLVDSLTKLEEKLSSQESHLDILRSNHQHLEDSHTQFEKKLNSQQTQHNILRSQHQHLEASHTQLQEKLSSQLTQHNTLRSNHQHLEAKVVLSSSRSDNQLSQQGVSISKLRASLQDLDIQHKTLENRTKRLQDSCNWSSENLREMKERLDNYVFHFKIFAAILFIGVAVAVNLVGKYVKEHTLTQT
jgi:chromosome segregation ATPase